MKNSKISRARAAAENLRYTGEKDDLGRPKKRHFPKELRRFDYALFRTQEAMDAAWEGFQKRTEEKREEYTKVVKVETGETNDKGEPVVQEQKRFKSVKASQEYKEWLEAELDEESAVNVHKLTDKKTIEYLEGDELPDEFFPDIYELEFIWKEDE